MPVLAFLGIILIIVIFTVARAMIHVIEAHATLAAGIALLGIPALAGASFAVIRGTMRHVILSAPAKPSRPQLPAPAPRREIEAAPGRPADPFSAGAPAWAQLAEDADREELLRPGPREARPAKCEGPGCASALGDAPWTVDAEADGEAELHSFCSGECARLWQESDARLWQESRGAS